MKTPYEVVFEQRDDMQIDVITTKIEEKIVVTKMILPESFKEQIEEFERDYGEVEDIAFHALPSKRLSNRQPLSLCIDKFIELITGEPYYRTNRLYPCHDVLLFLPNAKDNPNELNAKKEEMLN